VAWKYLVPGKNFWATPPPIAAFKSYKDITTQCHYPAISWAPDEWRDEFPASGLPDILSSFLFLTSVWRAGLGIYDRTRRDWNTVWSYTVRWVISCTCGCPGNRKSNILFWVFNRNRWSVYYIQYIYCTIVKPQ